MQPEYLIDCWVLCFVVHGNLCVRMVKIMIYMIGHSRRTQGIVTELERNLQDDDSALRLPHAFGGCGANFLSCLLSRFLFTIFNVPYFQTFSCSTSNSHRKMRPSGPLGSPRDPLGGQRRHFKVLQNYDEKAFSCHKSTL